MAKDPWSYRERWALVTGASAGIGEAFARALARRGMHVALAARREDRLRAVADELAAAHRVRTAVLPADLAEPGAAAALWTAATADGRDIHLLVNNAGFGLKGSFAELPVDRQSEMVRVNCIAPLELAHAALRHMRGRGGGIVNVASVAGYQPIPLLATYAASKAFVVTLSEALAEEVRADGIRIVTLNPGPGRTEFQHVAGTEVAPRAPGVRTAGEVAEAALHALETGRRRVTPGAINALGTVVGRVAPRSVLVRATTAVMKKLR